MVVSAEQVNEFLKASSLDEDAKTLIADLYSGFSQSLELVEKQAKQIKDLEAERANLKEANGDVVLQKVASHDAVKSAAEKIAGELVDNQLISEKSRNSMVQAITESPEKLANVVHNIFNSLTPSIDHGAGIDAPVKKASVDETENPDKFVPANDEFMDIIRNGA